MKNETKIKIKKILDLKHVKIAIYSFGILAIVFFIFQAGMIVGFRKASFGRDWGDNYTKNFGSPHRGFKMMGEDFGDFGNLPNAHGAIGKIIKVELPIIIVLDEKDNTEKIVLINEKTQIRKARDTVTKDEFKIDERIVVIGTPNYSGQIEARFIRFMPLSIVSPIKIN